MCRRRHLSLFEAEDVTCGPRFPHLTRGNTSYFSQAPLNAIKTRKVFIDKNVTPVQCCEQLILVPGLQIRWWGSQALAGSWTCGGGEWVLLSPLKGDWNGDAMGIGQVWG